MTLETAKKLAWPWPSPADEGEVRVPSVEEMLERMPGRVEYLVFKDCFGGYAVSNGMTSCEGDSLSEALALLAIWLRDNNLMEGWK